LSFGSLLVGCFRRKSSPIDFLGRGGSRYHFFLPGALAKFFFGCLGWNPLSLLAAVVPRVFFDFLGREGSRYRFSLPEALAKFFFDPFG
jgi:hypothetical protein